MNLEDFASASHSNTWSDDDIGFSMDVDAAVSWEKDRFKLLSAPLDKGAPQVFRLEWIGEGATLSDVERDFYRLYGRFAEQSQFVSRNVRASDVQYDVLVGTADHGHRAQFVVVGARVAAVVTNYFRVSEENASRIPRH
jgi:hypothetical protein